MNDPTARPGGRRGAPRRRRRQRRPSDHYERGAGGNSDGAQPSGNLTTINLLPPVEAPTRFADLGVPERIDVGLAAAGFAQPFAIQTEAIPLALEGRDVCGRAQTGSGKTLAFG
ncbi:MAG: DEAD/DEAH box helicase, partial [Ilumatobacteraceae bacterium]